MLADTFRYGCRRLRIRTEDNAPFFNIGTGNIDFHRIDSFYIKASRQLTVVFRRTGRHIDNKPCLQAASLRQNILQEHIYPRIFQADTIEHTAGRFGNTHAFISRSGKRGNTLGNDSPHRFHRKKIFIFRAETEGPRGTGKWRIHLKAEKLASQSVEIHQNTSLLSNTGPSEQTL